jgi:hypothetical protein
VGHRRPELERRGALTNPLFSLRYANDEHLQLQIFIRDLRSFTYRHLQAICILQRFIFKAKIAFAS